MKGEGEGREGRRRKRDGGRDRVRKKGVCFLF